MGYLRKVKNGFSKSTQSKAGSIAESEQEEILKRLARIEKQQKTMNRKLQREVLPAIRTLSKEHQAHDVQTKQLLWEGLRADDETIDDVRRRYFLSMPKATGSMRLLQLSNFELLKAFDTFCSENNLPYFILSGTLLGAMRHGGFIPWDDDLDVGMLHTDIERLLEAVEADDRYRVTVVYDQYVSCKQVRFRYVDDTIPCFVDVFYFDYCPANGTKEREDYKLMRNEIKERIAALRKDGTIGEMYLAAGRPGSREAEEVFADAAVQSTARGYACSRADASHLAWGVENIDPISPVADMYFPVDSIFPLTKVAFEGVELSAPQDGDAVLRLIFGDWLELPNDMFTHMRHIKVSPETEQRLREHLQAQGCQLA